MNPNDGIVVGTRNDRNYNNETEERTATHASAVYQTNAGGLVEVRTDLRTQEQIAIELDTGDTTGSPYLDPTLTDGPAPGTRVPMFMRMLQEVFLVESAYWFLCWVSSVIIVLMVDSDNVGVALWAATLTITLIVGFVAITLYVLLVAKIGERLQGARSDQSAGTPGITQWYDGTAMAYLYPTLGLMYIVVCTGGILAVKSGFVVVVTLGVWLASMCVLVIVTKWNTDITGGAISGAVVAVSCVIYIVSLVLTFDVFMSTVSMVVASQINAARLVWIFFYAKKLDKYTAFEGRRAHVDLYTEALYNTIVTCYHQAPGDMTEVDDDAQIMK